MVAALPPMPPETERGARVLLPEPINTPELKSEERTVLPEPLGAMVRLLLAVEVISGLPPPVKVRVRPLKAVVPVVPIVPKPVMVLAEVLAEILPIPEMFWLLPVIVPVSVAAPSWRVPEVAEIV